jgi:hypothetical protein
MGSRNIASLTFALAAAGCAGAGADVASVGPAAVRRVDPTHVGGEYVQAGTAFRITVDETLDTQVTAPGAVFTATVVDPLVAPDGMEVVPRGAKVYGTVTSIGTYGEPRLRIDLQRVDTPWGPASLLASVRHEEHMSYAGRPRFEPSSSPAFENGFLYPYDFYTYATPIGPAPYPPAPPVYGVDVERPREIRIPHGTTLDLVLTRALIAPGTRVR